jgi:multiple sugar transport system permease protein
MRPNGSFVPIVATHAALLAAAAVVLIPFLWITAAAFKTQIALLTGALAFTPTLANMNELLFSKTSEYLHNFSNSLIVAVTSTAVVLTVATLAAHALVRRQAPGWLIHGLLGWSIAFHIIPPITMAGAWFTMFRTVGLDNTLTGLILAHVTLHLPMALWLMCVFVREVPVELEEAAFIDGATAPQLFMSVVVPLVRPGLAAAGILTFVFSWNEFAVALNLTQKATATVPVAIAKYAQEYEIKYTEMAAGALLSALPAIVILLLGQRHIVRGLTAGAVK